MPIVLTGASTGLLLMQQWQKPLLHQQQLREVVFPAGQSASMPIVRISASTGM
jgi:hypothetical protein